MICEIRIGDFLPTDLRIRLCLGARMRATNIGFRWKKGRGRASASPAQGAIISFTSASVTGFL
jgi:hypothetical protein